MPLKLTETNLSMSVSMPLKLTETNLSMSVSMPLKLTETNLSIKHRRLKIPYWRGTDQLAIYKYDRGVELVSTEKQLQLSGQKGT